MRCNTATLVMARNIKDILALSRIARVHERFSHYTSRFFSSLFFYKGSLSAGIRINTLNPSVIA
jgi:hypothetical protein